VTNRSGSGGLEDHTGSTGNDVIVWNNGDGSDLDDGGAGTDETLIVTATADDRPDRQALRSDRCLPANSVKPQGTR
jgi:hypothetical protein